ncbi:type IV pili methyl-accepting chemotaxis transducer N-terminal domain-containing protein [Variovorax rhizosphaerae]|uniref:Type IV pili methyl-accepting chemotaxis transducer N-terminal domain-containing protein n=1 Tax=Variovorax rhizosphaerae TaxID=1836200 RepID=A0ABU8WFN8_9BURK
MIRLHVVLLDPPGAPALSEAVRGALQGPEIDLVVHASLAAAAAHELAGPGAEQLLVCTTTASIDANALAPLAMLSGLPRWPVSVLSRPLDASTHADLVNAGVHAWGDIDSVDAIGLLALLARANARWQRESALKSELVQLQKQMDERKWVDKAKGLLMMARGMGEDEAFALLRRTSMHANLRLGEVSRSVVDAAQWAEAINRAGQLRMQAQRLGRLAAQTLAGVDVPRSRTQRKQSSERVQANLGYLAGLDLDEAAAAELDRTKAAWQSLSDAWTPRVTREAMTAIDAAAEVLLASAEALTLSLESASGRRALKIINLCGRQRMLSERLAKEALLALALPASSAPALASTADEFEKALLELERAPLTSPEIREALAGARDEWLRFARGVQGIRQPRGSVAVVRSAEALVDTFDQLAAQYEHSLQVIMS